MRIHSSNFTYANWKNFKQISISNWSGLSEPDFPNGLSGINSNKVKNSRENIFGQFQGDFSVIKYFIITYQRNRTEMKIKSVKIYFDPWLPHVILPWFCDFFLLSFFCIDKDEERCVGVDGWYCTLVQSNIERVRF